MVDFNNQFHPIQCAMTGAAYMLCLLAVFRPSLFVFLLS